MYVFDSVPTLDDVPLDKDEAVELTQDFITYEKIFEMDDATRCYKSLNNQPLNHSEFSDANDSICNSHGNTLNQVLSRFQIDKKTYLRFRSRLEETKLRVYCSEGSIHAYMVDGWLDNVWGYCYSESKLELNNQQFQICGYTIQVVQELGDNWYRFGGSWLT